MKRISCISSLVLIFIVFAFSNLNGQTLNRAELKKQKRTLKPVAYFKEENIKQTMKKVFQWQINHPMEINDVKEQWARSVFYSGIMYAYGATKDPDYLNETVKWGSAHGWKRGKKFRYADDLVCGQAYLDVYAVRKQPEMLLGIKVTIDSLMADPRPGKQEWWWCDALFMEPPVIARLGRLTHDNRYFEYLDQKYRDASGFLYSTADSLYFRDKRYFDMKTKNGKKTFWSRGNAWVIGGLVQILSQLPKDYPGYKRYEDHYKAIMIKIASLQQADGLWRASLLDPEEVPVKETSGSAFFTFAMAWGVNNGLIDRNTYLPQVIKGWNALMQAVASDGKLQYVQQIGDRPDNVKAADSQEYGGGAFLMAASEIIKLSEFYK